MTLSEDLTDGPPGPGGSGVLTDAPSGTALRVTGLSKSFPGTRALNNVSLHVQRGEVLGLLGGNGSGKSTLIKVLAGVHLGDPGGTIEVGATSSASDAVSPQWSAAAGVHVVHQHAAVFPDLSVAENLAVGRGFPTHRGGSVDWKALRARTETVLDRFGISARPETMVRNLRAADRTMIAIARALQDQEDAHSGVLILDEPTASLPKAEVSILLDAVRRYADAGLAIVFVSHRLDEVETICDRITVLRDGIVVGDAEGDDVTQERMIQLIVGRALDRVFPAMPAVTSDEKVLEISGVSGGPLRGVDLTLRRGEIVGIAGLLGSGRTELLRMVFGAYPVKGGEILVNGTRIRTGDINAAMDAGVAYVPEDRAEAAFPDLPLAANLSAAVVSKYWKGLRLRHRRENSDAMSAISRFGIKAVSGTQPMRTLSGGNQQKAILARWLQRKPGLLLLDEPTQGVDINARAEIYGLVRDAVAEGCSVLVVASDFEELCQVSDRVVVLAGGRITTEVSGDDLEPTTLTRLSFTAPEATR